jgi:hypothetical protein
MKKQDHRKPFWARDKNKPTFSESQPQLERLRTLSQWLLIFPIVMLVLFACGQIGILTSHKIAESNTLTNMEADYGPWSYVLIHSLKPEIIDEIIRDKPKEDGEGGAILSTSEGHVSWVDSTPNTSTTPSLSPTITPTIPKTNLPSPSDTPQISPSPLPTQIQTQITATSSSVPPTPTANNSPTATHPPPTETPTIIATPSPTYPTPSTEDITLWMSGVGSFSKYKLVTTQPNGTGKQRSATTNFSTDPFPENSTIEGGKTTIYFFATNPSDQPMTMGINLLAVEGHRSFPIGGTDISIPAGTTSPTLFTKSFSIIKYNLGTNGSLKLTMFIGVNVTIYWDGEWNDARLVVPPINP